MRTSLGVAAHTVPLLLLIGVAFNLPTVAMDYAANAQRLGDIVSGHAVVAHPPISRIYALVAAIVESALTIAVAEAWLDSGGAPRVVRLRRLVARGLDLAGAGALSIGVLVVFSIVAVLGAVVIGFASYAAILAIVVAAAVAFSLPFFIVELAFVAIVAEDVSLVTALRTASRRLRSRGAWRTCLAVHGLFFVISFGVGAASLGLASRVPGTGGDLLLNAIALALSVLNFGFAGVGLAVLGRRLSAAQPAARVAR